MNYYLETLEKAKDIIKGSKISSDEKTFLIRLIPRLSLDMLEVFVWTIEEDPQNAQTVVEKIRRLVATSTDSIEMRKAIEKDKKEMEALIAADAVMAS
jgi:hypothetical protein